eukprot:SAG31_NODE_1429_length_8390_cov_2.259076_10_plen_56_part_00
MAYYQGILYALDKTNNIWQMQVPACPAFRSSLLILHSWSSIQGTQLFMAPFNTYP